MIKKCKIMLLVSIFVLTACTNSEGKKTSDNSVTSNQQENEILSTEVEKATKAYNEFLDNKISVGKIDMNFITIPTGEPNSHYGTKYALFDSNGDEIPELHICSARYYYVLTYINEKLTIFKNLSPNPQYYALKNGAFISHLFGGGPLSDSYCYYIFDYMGNIVWTVNFSKYDKNQNGVYDKNDEYMFDGVKVSKKIWGALTEQYIYVDEDGIEQIRNEIEWTVIYEKTT
ncbi:hypothetical protein [Anaerosporobacter faecicola]|uniref:hypothetical protein n=1 Tax=Anaerosporobacter faecicola TaxID=2718714 RepID=UPI001439C73E|nr:hypothetical protein [Anaerosporobacter faecicola]